MNFAFLKIDGSKLFFSAKAETAPTKTADLTEAGMYASGS